MSDAQLLTRRDAWTAAALAALTLFCGWMLLVPGACGYYHDDGIYVCTAKALAEGRGYRLINLPNAPPQTKYPILWPAVLALLWPLAPFPTNVVLMQALTLACGASLVAAAYLFLVGRGYAGRGAALAACLVCGTSPTFLYFATLVLTEMPFGLACLLALWVLERDSEEQLPSWWLGLAFALPPLLRSAGAPVTLAAYLVLWRRGRPAMRAACVSALALAPWLLWSLGGLGGWHRDPVQGYYTDYFGWWRTEGALEPLRVVPLNVILAACGSFGPALSGITWLTQGPGDIVWVPTQFALGVLVWAEVGGQAARGKALPVPLFAYLGLILLWPWPPLRFLVPLWPLLLGVGMERLARSVGRAGPWLAAALVLLNLGAVYRQASSNAVQGWPGPAGLDQPVNRERYEELFDWVRANTREGDVIASPLDPMVYLHTGRPAVRPYVERPLPLFYSGAGHGVGTVDELADTLRRCGARYLLDTPLPGYKGEAEYHANVSALANAGRLRLVHRSAMGPRFAVYEVRPEG